MWLRLRAKHQSTSKFHLVYECICWSGCQSMSDDDVVFLDHMTFQSRMGQAFSEWLQLERVTCCMNSCWLLRELAAKGVCGWIWQHCYTCWDSLIELHGRISVTWLVHQSYFGTAVCASCVWRFLSTWTWQHTVHPSCCIKRMWNPVCIVLSKCLLSILPIPGAMLLWHVRMSCTGFSVFLLSVFAYTLMLLTRHHLRFKGAPFVNLCLHKNMFVCHLHALHWNLRLTRLLQHVTRNWHC